MRYILFLLAYIELIGLFIHAGRRALAEVYVSRAVVKFSDAYLSAVLNKKKTEKKK